jgi:hypothetical protein
MDFQGCNQIGDIGIEIYKAIKREDNNKQLSDKGKDKHKNKYSSGRKQMKTDRMQGCDDPISEGSQLTSLGG